MDSDDDLLPDMSCPKLKNYKFYDSSVDKKKSVFIPYNTHIKYINIHEAYGPEEIKRYEHIKIGGILVGGGSMKKQKFYQTKNIDKWTCGWMSRIDIQSGGIPYGTSESRIA